MNTLPISTSYRDALYQTIYWSFNAHSVVINVFTSFSVYKDKDIVRDVYLHNTKTIYTVHFLKRQQKLTNKGT